MAENATLIVISITCCSVMIMVAKANGAVLWPIWSKKQKSIDFSKDVELQGTEEKVRG